MPVDNLERCRDVTVNIKQNTGNGSPYPCTLTVGTTTLDPDLISDP